MFHASIGVVAARFDAKPSQPIIPVLAVVEGVYVLCRAGISCLAGCIAVRLALRGKAARRPATEKDILPHPLATLPYRQGASSIDSRIEQPRRSIDVIVGT